MTPKQVLKRGLFLFIIGLIANILETWYFGWHRTAQSVQESYADIITGAPIFIGIVMVVRYLFTFEIRR
jgi:hypothetical protein